MNHIGSDYAVISTTKHLRTVEFSKAEIGSHRQDRGIKQRTQVFRSSFHRWLGILMMVMLAPSVARAEYKVLFIGNSFTIGSGGGGVPGIFDRLAQAGGHENPTTVMQAVGGMDYQFHSQDPAALAAINSQQWTHVILQNYSTEPTHLVDGSHSIADHLNYGAILYQQIMANNPQTKV